MHFILLLISFSVFAHDKLHESPKWLKLLHYRKNFYGRFVSEADSKKFFLSEKGKTNPKEELKKSIEAFGSSSTPDNNHPICQFPLRFKWLNKELGMPWKADISGCTNYINFFSKLAARRASIIFSSYYLTNPNSAFGHTLLRLSRFDDKNETEMLDYGINYAAQAKETNPFLYAWKGLFGGFIGEFAAVPYYYKIREYSNFEFRDLWSYDLELSMPEILEMVDHIWELGSTHFDYFYFHENCSYHLLSIIDVARPELDLTSNYHLYTIPADTIRLLHEKGLIDDGRRRESTYSRLTRLSQNLSSADLELARKISENPDKANPAVNADILDVSIEAFDYKNFERILKDDQKTKELKAPLLRARALNPQITNVDQNLDTVKLDSPAYSHAPTRLTFAENYTDKMGKASRFEYRAALHDLLDPPAGSMKEAQLEIGKLSFEWKENHYQNPKLILDGLSVFNIKNFPQQNFWASPVSWEVDVGGKQLKRTTCFDCPAVFVNGSVGNSLQMARNKVLLAFLLNGEIDIQNQFADNYRLGLGPKFLSRFRFSDKFLMKLESYYHFNSYENDKLFQDYEWWNDLEFRYHFSGKFSLALKGGGIERDESWQRFGELGLQYFYE